MLKAALGVLFSVFALVLTSPAAHSAEGSTSGQRSSKNKSQAQKATAPKVAKRRTTSAQTAKRSAKKASQTQQAAVAPATRRKAGIQRVAYAPSAGRAAAASAGDLAGLHRTHDPLALKSNVAFVIDQNTSEVLLEKNANVALPIASITKLMTALVVVEANQSMDEVLHVTDADIDREKFSHSRLRVGSQLTRAEMLHISLMSSENRAASALGRHYPGGQSAFLKAMNAKARQLGMNHTQYADATGLSSANVASARDLAKLVVAAHQHPLLRRYSTDPKHTVEPGSGALHYKNSNYLVDNTDWEIGLQKTGYIAEAGRCLVMQAKIEGRSVVMVFLDSKGKLSRIADASRVRRWIETQRPFAAARVASNQS